MRWVSKRVPRDMNGRLSVGKVHDKGPVPNNGEDSARPEPAAIRFRHPHLGISREALSTLASYVRAAVE